MRGRGSARRKKDSVREREEEVALARRGILRRGRGSKSVVRRREDAKGVACGRGQPPPPKPAPESQPFRERSRDPQAGSPASNIHRPSLPSQSTTSNSCVIELHRYPSTAGSFPRCMYTLAPTSETLNSNPASTARAQSPSSFLRGSLVATHPEAARHTECPTRSRTLP